MGMVRYGSQIWTLDALSPGGVFHSDVSCTWIAGHLQDADWISEVAGHESQLLLKFRVERCWWTIFPQ